jgi:uncharacterized protein YecT (DUF1311 family)
MNLRWALMVLLLPNGLPSHAQLDFANKETKSECAKYLETSLPVEAAVVPAPKKWPDCNSYKLYSGIGTDIDYAAARKCAWSERLAQLANLEPRYTVASVFGGSAMLSVLYANGEGIPQDLELAKRFVCEADGAPAEIKIRLQHIESLHYENKSRESKFNFCDDITSGFMEGFCAAYGSEIQDQKRTEKLKEITSSFTPTQRTSFDQLLKSEKTYAHAHAKGEMDLSGTARAMYQIDAEDTLFEDFIEALRTFEAGKYPSGSAKDYATADSELNAAYQDAMTSAEKSKSDYGAVQPGGIRDAERAWLKYRDAFIAFAKIRYSGVPAEAWLTLLTKDRRSILDGSFCDMDDIEGSCAKSGDTWKPSPLP